jgi:hypothetical protein
MGTITHMFHYKLNKTNKMLKDRQINHKTTLKCISNFNLKIKLQYQSLKIHVMKKVKQYNLMFNPLLEYLTFVMTKSNNHSKDDSNNQANKYLNQNQSHRNQYTQSRCN